MIQKNSTVFTQKLNNVQRLNDFHQKLKEFYQKLNFSETQRSLFATTLPNGNPELIAQLGQLFHLTGSKQWRTQKCTNLIRY